MNKELNLFKYYKLSEFFKAIIMILLFSLVPFVAVILVTINVALLMLPDFYIVITIMIVVLLLILALSTKVFITTLKNYRIVDEMNYKGLYYMILLPLGALATGLSYFIASLFL